MQLPRRSVACYIGRVITRRSGPCVFCRKPIAYGEHRARSGYAKQPWMTDGWVEKQAAFWPDRMAAGHVYTRDTSHSCTEDGTDRTWMSDWTFSVEAPDPFGRSHGFEILEPFTCPECTAALKARALPSRLAFEREHRERGLDDLASRAPKRRQEFSLIRGKRA